MEVIRNAYYHRPGPGMRLVRLGTTRREAAAALSKWRAEQQAVRLAASDPWLAVRRNMLSSMRKRCRERGWAPLTSGQIEALWVRAGGRCEVSGIPFSLERQEGTLKRPWAPSLDRRDARQRYTVENARLVCTAVNLAMNEWGEATLRRIAQALAE